MPFSRFAPCTLRAKLRPILGLARMLFIGPALLLSGPFQGYAQPPHEAYYNFLGDYPEMSEPGWQEEAQGLTSDLRANWFITQRWTLWKIPVSHDLADVDRDEVSTRELCYPFYTFPSCTKTDMPELLAEFYNHLGDPCYFEGFVLVPVEGGGRCAIAAFRANDVKYLGHVPLEGQDASPWCAVDPEGNLYSSNFGEVTSIRRYVVDWNTLRETDQLRPLSGGTPVLLYDENGSSIRLEHMQGGAISPSGRLLYLVAGYTDRRPTDGIHVFDLSTGRRIKRSANGTPPFNYQLGNKEPEGITIWDLEENNRVPDDKLRGQLHVLLKEDRWFWGDRVAMKHYTNSIHVDGDCISDVEEGTPPNPFNTVTEAHDFAWDGARLKIKAGFYPEQLILSKRIEAVSVDGTATIGRRAHSRPGANERRGGMRRDRR